MSSSAGFFFWLINQKKKPALKRVHKPTPAMFFVPRDLDFLFFNPRINGFPGRMKEHIYVKFGDPSCLVFLDIVQQTDKRLSPRLPLIWAIILVLQ